MKYVRRISLALGCLSVLVLCGSGQAGGKPTSPLDSTATIFDTDAQGQPLLLRSDDYGSSGAAVYTSGSDVSSVVWPDSAWQLMLRRGTPRTVFLTLASQGAPIPDGYYSTDMEVYNQCFDGNLNPIPITSIAPGVSYGYCSFGVVFSTGGVKYRFVMSPKFPGTGLATVTCFSASNGACNSWTIVPNMDAANPTVAQLYRFANHGGLILVGTYHNTYRVAVTVP